MGDPNAYPPLAAAAIFGVTAHLLFFKRFEIDTHPLLLFVVFGLAPFLLQYSLPATLSWAFLLTATFTASLLASIAIYRLYLHPLRHFPGPPLARLTQLHALTLTARSGLKWHQVLQSLHSRYGDYVRTGPRELSVADPAAMSSILGYGARPGKGPVYDSMEESVNTTRDRDFHTQRRKVWDSGLRTLTSTYAPQIEDFTSTLLARIRSGLGTPITINELALHYSYDVATQLAFGQAGGFIRGDQSEAAESVMAGIKDAMFALGLLFHVPWLMTLLTTFSFLPGPMKAWNDWSEKMLQERKQRGAEHPDLMGHLMANTPETRKGNNLLFAESRLIVAAGSDTTATALTTLFTLLAASPTLVAQVRAEVDPKLSHAPATFSCATSSPVLDSIINEALRLYPPVLFASQRTNAEIPIRIPPAPAPRKPEPGPGPEPDEPGPEREPPSPAREQRGTYIPRDTILSMPTYTLHRDARSFPRPGEFVPERWTTQPGLVRNRQAFIPFSTGMTNCPGRTLAMMELRDVLARTIVEFDASFPAAGGAGGFDVEAFMRGARDCFVAAVPDVELVFRKRDRGLQEPDGPG